MKLGIDRDFIIWTSFFFLNQEVQLFINKYNNKKINIKTQILQDSPKLLLFFLIYISNIFNKVLEKNFLVILLLFVNELRLIALGNSVVEIIKPFGNITQVVLD